MRAFPWQISRTNSRTARLTTSWRIIMKRPGQCLSLLARASAFASSITGRAVWLALATMLSASAASAAGPILGGLTAPYQQYGAAPSCGAGGCAIIFPAVTTETLITQVTCYFYLTNTGPAYFAELANDAPGIGIINIYFPPIETGVYNGDSYYAINAQTQLFLSSGQQPSVTVLNSSGAIAQLDCSVSGYTGSQLAAEAGIAPPPSAQPVPASAASATEPILPGQPAPYQQFIQASSCSALSCAITFPTVRVETLISQVTCYFTVPNTEPVYAAYLSNGASGAGQVVNSFSAIGTGTVNGNTQYVINAQTQMLLSSGQTPSVHVFNSVGTIGQLLCSVSGYAGSALPAAAGPTPPADGPLPPTPAGLMPPSPGLPR
jgi:hypothetical protein